MIYQLPAAILLDWDHCVVDPAYDACIIASLNTVNEAYGRPFVDSWECFEVYSDFLNHYFGGDSAQEKMYEQAFYTHHLSKVSLHEGALDLIHNAFALGIPVAIVSNKDHFILMREIEHLGLAPYLRSVYGDKGVPHSELKPGTYPLQYTLDQLAIGPDAEVWYVDNKAVNIAAAAPLAQLRRFLISPEGEYVEGAETISNLAALLPMISSERTPGSAADLRM